MSFAASLLAVLIFVALRKTISSQLIRGLAAITSSCSALFFGYAMWGGVKELVMAPLIGLTMYLATNISSLTIKRSPLSILPFSIVASSIIAIAGLVGAVWILVPTVYFIAKCFRNFTFKEVRPALFTFFASTIFLIFPSLLLSNIFNLKALLNFTTGSKDIGNLIGPLDRKQILGIWPTGDFRFAPSIFTKPFNLLLLIVLFLVFLGIYQSWKSKNSFIFLMTCSALIYSLIFSFGNAWIGGKCLAMSSPFVLMSAFCGIAFLINLNHKIEATLSLVLVVGGVALSYLHIFHEVWLAPYSQLKQLQTIGEDARLASPTLMIEYSPYSVRHFLRNLTPEGAGELRRNLIPLKTGLGLDKGIYADIDDFKLSSIEAYNTLILRRSPIASRPPSNYKLMYELQNYEVWEKDLNSPQILQHISYGNDNNPGSTPRCIDLVALSKSAPQGSRFAAVTRTPNLNLDLNQSSLPLNWSPGNSSGSVVPKGNGGIESQVTVSQPGNYSIWVGGSYRGKVNLVIDGKDAYASSAQINHSNSYIQLGTIFLTTGTHRIQFTYTTSLFSPGSGGPSFEVGPVVFSHSSANLPVKIIAPSQLKSLCGKSIDWIEEIK
jgi:hypothetical protein